MKSALLFGLPYIAGGLENVLTELYRILQLGGTLSFAKTRGSNEKLIKEVERKGFKYFERRGRIFLFKKGLN